MGKLIVPQWQGIRLTREQLSVRWQNPMNGPRMRNVLAQLQGFRERYETARKMRPVGFTMDSLGNVRDYEKGYAVGLSRYDDVDEMIFNNQNVLACGELSSLHFGYWRDTKTGEEYVETSEVFALFSDAIRFAFERSQKAIYDFADKSDIQLHGPSWLPADYVTYFGERGKHETDRG